MILLAAAGIKKKGLHWLRHTFASSLVNGIKHSDVSTTMNIYAHATREAKRTSARLLDKVVGTA